MRPPSELIDKKEFLKTGTLFFSFSVLLFITRGHPFEVTFLKWSWVAPSWFSTMVVDNLQLALSTVAAVVTVTCLVGIGFPGRVSKLVWFVKASRIAVVFYWLTYGLCFLGSWLKAYVEALNQDSLYFAWFVVVVGLILLTAAFWISPAR